jgi:hypothetical protein
VTADIKNVVADRLGVGRLAPNVAAWVASALARRVELWDDKLVLPTALAARAAVLAFGSELVDLELPAGGFVADSNGWLSPDGRSFAAAYLLPRASAALLPELQRLADGRQESALSSLTTTRRPRALPGRERSWPELARPLPRAAAAAAAAAVTAACCCCCCCCCCPCC